MPTSAKNPSGSPTAAFSYGGYTLSHVVTKSYQHLPVYDPSGVDFLYTRHVLHIQGQLAEGLTPLNSRESPAQALRRIEHDMLRPRQNLEYSSDGHIILEVKNNNQQVHEVYGSNGVMRSFVGPDSVAPALDADNGPKPRSFNVVTMTQKAITVEYVVEVCLINCENSTARKRGYTSHRWSESEDYDQAGYCTLTTKGLLICASDLKVNPDQLRDIVAPVIRNGYIRESSNWCLSECGLKLSYIFRDREYFLGPPHPAKKASGQFLICMSSGRYFAQCTLRLEGDKSTDKQALMTRAIQIVNAKISAVSPQAPAAAAKATGPNNSQSSGLSGIGASVVGERVVGALEGYNGTKKQPIVTNATFSESLYECIVDVSYRCQIDARVLGTVGSGAKVNMFGTPLPGSPAYNQPGIAPPLRGNNVFLQLLASKFNDPCVMKSFTQATLSPSTTVLNPPPRNETPGASPGNQPDAPSVTTVTPLKWEALEPVSYGSNPASIMVAPDVLALYSSPSISSGAEIPYDVYTIKMSYLSKTGFDVLPGSWFDSTKAASAGYDKAGFSLNKKVRKHNPVLTLIAEWSAERVGVPPEIPDPCPDDCNICLIENAIVLDEIRPIDGGGYLHRISGRYVYKCLDTTLVPLAAAVPPFLIAEIQEKTGSGGSLAASARTSADYRMAILEVQIQRAASQLDRLVRLSRTDTSFDYSGQIQSQQQYQRLLEIQKDSIFDATAPNVKRRREGDYALNQGILFYRLKTLAPGPIFGDCWCPSTPTSGPTLVPIPSNGAHTGGSNGTGGGGDWGGTVTVTGILQTSP